MAHHVTPPHTVPFYTKPCTVTKTFIVKHTTPYYNIPTQHHGRLHYTTPYNKPPYNKCVRLHSLPAMWTIGLFPPINKWQDVRARTMLYTQGIARRQEFNKRGARPLLVLHNAFSSSLRYTLQANPRWPTVLHTYMRTHTDTQPD